MLLRYLGLGKVLFRWEGLFTTVLVCFNAIVRECFKSFDGVV